MERYRGDYDMMICVSWSILAAIIGTHSSEQELLKTSAMWQQSHRNRSSREYDGGTAFIDPYGQPIALCSDNKEEVIICETDLQILKI